MLQMVIFTPQDYANCKDCCASYDEDTVKESRGGFKET